MLFSFSSHVYVGGLDDWTFSTDTQFEPFVIVFLNLLLHCPPLKLLDRRIPVILLPLDLQWLHLHGAVHFSVWAAWFVLEYWNIMAGSCYSVTFESFMHRNQNQFPIQFSFLTQNCDCSFWHFFYFFGHYRENNVQWNMGRKCCCWLPSYLIR